MIPLNTQLIMGTLMTMVTICFHVAALVGLVSLLARIAPMLEKTHRKLGTTILMVTAVFGITVIHTIETWSWAALFMLLGEFDSLERALYFSVATHTTLGYGDIILSPEWQLLGTFESMGGLILFGVSTAFLFGLVRHLFQDVPSPLKWR